MAEKELTSEQLEKRNHEEILKNREVSDNRAVEDAKVAVQEAQTALDKAKADLKAAEAGAKGGKGGGAASGDVKEQTEKNIESGKAPIEPGPEKPVDVDDAAEAKENRGRGLG